MNATYQEAKKVWLKTDHPVVSVNRSMRGNLSPLEAALRCGVMAVADENRVEFYEIRIGDDWYYIHTPKHAPKVYLVAIHSKGAKKMQNFPCLVS